jgi:C4-dicarboxylate transporter
MSTAYLVVALMAIAANAFSGVAAIVHFKPIIPAMARAGVPESDMDGVAQLTAALGQALGSRIAHRPTAA